MLVKQIFDLCIFYFTVNMWLNNCLNVDKHVFVIQAFVNLAFGNVVGILSED